MGNGAKFVMGNGTRSAVGHGARFDVAQPCWWTVPPAWPSQQSADNVECRRQMSGAGSQQSTPALFHEDSGRPERNHVPNAERLIHV